MHFDPRSDQRGRAVYMPTAGNICHHQGKMEGHTHTLTHEHNHYGLVDYFMKTCMHSMWPLNRYIFFICMLYFQYLISHADWRNW